jgi:hypothetical protein
LYPNQASFCFGHVDHHFIKSFAGRCQTTPVPPLFPRLARIMTFA